jgi:hypothetical protein
MDILGKIKSAIVRGRINMTDHADEELANDEILDEEYVKSAVKGFIRKKFTKR